MTHDQLARFWLGDPPARPQKRDQCAGKYSSACKKCQHRKRCIAFNSYMDSRKDTQEKWPHLYCKHRIVYAKCTGCRKLGGGCRGSKCPHIDPAHI